MEFAMRLLALDRATAEVVTALREQGVPSILLKGPAMSRWLYKEGESRGYADIDLLVPDHGVGDAESVLHDLRFERHGLETIPGDWPRYSYTWNRREGNINVDLHQTLVGIGVEPGRLWEVLSKATEPMEVGGRDVDVLQPGARALVLALHAAKDGPRIAKARHDLGHAVTRLPPEVWAVTTALAEQLDAKGGLAAGLRLVVPEGVHLADSLGLTAEAPPDVAIRADHGAPPLAVGLGWLLGSPGRRGKVRLVLRKTFPPVAYIRAWKPLARKGRLGLAAAYLWRPFWVAWHLGPALRAWLRVREGSSKRPHTG
jgi:Uncharacterised nucleotidyltransferase